MLGVRGRGMVGKGFEAVKLRRHVLQRLGREVAAVPRQALPQHGYGHVPLRRVELRFLQRHEQCEVFRFQCIVLPSESVHNHF